MKTYIYNLTKYFLIFLLMFVCTKGEMVKASEVNYKSLLTGETKEEVSVNKIDKGFNIDIKNNLPEGKHTTAYFSPSVEEDISEYGAFSFNLTNKSEGEIKLNFIINGVKRNYLLEEGDCVLAMEEGSSTLRKFIVDNGVFELPKDFKGTIYIPLNVLSDNYFGTIQSWGMTLTCRNGENKNFEISSFNYIEKNEAKKYNNIAEAVLEGDLEVPVPTIGESIVDYKINKNAGFSLKDNYSGVSITNNGHLNVESSAKVGDIDVYVKLADGNEFFFKVKLTESLTKSLMGVTNKSLATPSLDEVANNKGFLTDVLLNAKMLFVFRTIIVLSAIWVAVVYLNWRGYFKKFTNDKNLEE